jgi:trehalose 6-phosphate phosphatase
VTAAEPPAPALVEALRAFAGPGRVLIALDFDGTIAPIVDRPPEARALPPARDAVLRLLGMPDTRVAFVSGRSLESLVDAAEPPEGLLLVGSHGIEVQLDHDRDPLAMDPAESTRAGALRELLEEIAASTQGAWVEAKPAGSALHTRDAAEDDARRAEALALARIRDEIGELTMRRGKRVIEFAVRDATKGDGITLLRRHVGADRVLYAGDDLTDEDAFAVLGPHDLGIKSGQGETRAGFRVSGPAEVAEALQVLADLRSAAIPSPQ